MKLTKQTIREKMKRDQKTSLGNRYVFTYKGVTHVAFGTESEAVEHFYKKLR